MLVFFDLFDGHACVPDPATPPWVNHLALRVDGRIALESALERLGREGIDTVGIVDHGWFDSIYFFDPNGIRLELVSVTASDAELADMAADAHRVLTNARTANEVAL